MGSWDFDKNDGLERSADVYALMEAPEFGRYHGAMCSHYQAIKERERYLAEQLIAGAESPAQPSLLA